MTLVSVNRLSVSYSGHTVVCDLTLQIQHGDFVLLTGPSGCGKSTLAMCLAGIIPHALPAHVSGHIVVDGLEIRAHSLAELVSHVGLVFQNPATQLFNDTVEEEIAFAPHNLGLSGEEITARVEFALHSVGISHLRKRQVRKLSGGEQQRVTIAAVMALKPKFLILDEPMANLDRKSVEQLLSTLEKLNREEVTILLIEHRLPAAGRLAKRILLMHEGRLVADGPAGEVLARREKLAALGLRYPWPTSNRDLSLILPEGIAIRPVNCPPLVRLHRVNAGYTRQPVLKDIDLALYPGEFVALVGDNGAGKTTLGQVLAGIIRPRRGRIIWDASLRRLPPGRRVGYLFQNPYLQFLCDTVEEEAAFGAVNFQLPLATYVDHILKAAGLHSLRWRHPLTLSVGQQQRLALVAVLSSAPRLIIADEPTLGQDWGHLDRLMSILNHLREAGHTILLITHDDKLICRYAERIVHLDDGRIVADGAPRLRWDKIPWISDNSHDTLLSAVYSQKEDQL